MLRIRDILVRIPIRICESVPLTPDPANFVKSKERTVTHCRQMQTYVYTVADPGSEIFHTGFWIPGLKDSRSQILDPDLLKEF